MLLALDPSSTRTGYAVVDKIGARVVDAGTLRPARVRDDANRRIEVMAGELEAIIQEHGVTVIVIEDTSGKVARRHSGGGAGLAIHGKAVGWFIAECRRLVGAENVHAVLENDWTRGSNKFARQRWIAAQWKGYEAVRDRGADAADAIGLGLWWINQSPAIQASQN